MWNIKRYNCHFLYPEWQLCYGERNLTYLGFSHFFCKMRILSLQDMQLYLTRKNWQTCKLAGFLERRISWGRDTVGPSYFCSVSWDLLSPLGFNLPHSLPLKESFLFDWSSYCGHIILPLSLWNIAEKMERSNKALLTLVNNVGNKHKWVYGTRQSGI